MGQVWESRTKSSLDAELEHGRFGGSVGGIGTIPAFKSPGTAVFITRQAFRGVWEER